MEMIAVAVARRLGQDGGIFRTAEGESLDVVCGRQAVRVEEGFGKKRFIFGDGSAITVGDGRWAIGFANCFCELGQGHFTGCHNTEPAPVPQAVESGPHVEEVPSGQATEVLPAPPAFTIYTYGKINSSIALEGSRDKARRQARGLLSTVAGVSHSWLMDASGRIIDAYELVPLPDGGSRIRKIKPGELSKLNQIELPL
ncbi:MAG: hypothetical protein HQL73_12005 [Magnetococcales bacterium]|nr:hypothetical protein [Magnetococcales bacterium]